MEILRQISIWFGQTWDTLRSQPGELFRQFLVWLLGIGDWLRAGNIGLLLALVILVFLINRVLNRHR